MHVGSQRDPLVLDASCHAHVKHFSQAAHWTDPRCVAAQSWGRLPEFLQEPRRRRVMSESQNRGPALRVTASPLAFRAIAHLDNAQTVTQPFIESQTQVPNGRPLVSLRLSLVMLERFKFDPPLRSIERPRLQPLAKAVTSTRKTIKALELVPPGGGHSTQFLNAKKQLERTLKMLESELRFERRRLVNGNLYIFTIVFAALRVSMPEYPKFSLVEIRDLIMNSSDDWLEPPCPKFVEAYLGREDTLTSSLSKWMQRAKKL